MYPLTVLCAPLSDALPVAVLDAAQPQGVSTAPRRQSVRSTATYTMMAARRACGSA